MEETYNIRFLEEKAKYLRKQICSLSNESQIDHIHLGGLLSSVDILTALYYKYMNFDVHDVNNAKRDLFVPSKAHCAVLLYLIFADLGLYKYEDIFNRFKKMNQPFYQVPIRKIKGIEVSTGSLGHGLAVACGMALANRARDIESRVYCLVGDGEMQEGSNWEAIMYAGSHRLGNLVCIVDDNRCTAAFRHGDNITIDWEKSFKGFNWEVNIINGANMVEIVKVFETMEKVEFQKNQKPTAIIAQTIKGQGVDFVQGPGWHYGCLSNKDLIKALASIERTKEM